MALIARKGDTSSHGGTITTGTATKSYAEGKLIALEGSILDCPAHGNQAIDGNLANSKCEGKRIAVNGSTAHCGAVIISGATKSKAT